MLTTVREPMSVYVGVGENCAFCVFMFTCVRACVCVHVLAGDQLQVLSLRTSLPCFYSFILSVYMCALVRMMYVDGCTYHAIHVTLRGQP